MWVLELILLLNSSLDSRFHGNDKAGWQSWMRGFTQTRIKDTRY